MITPSSNNSSSSGFGTYFKFRLRSQLKYMIICFVLNMFMLPLFAVNVLIFVKSKYEYELNGVYLQSQFNTLTSGFQTLSALALFFLTIFSATKVFDYCVKSNRTDTFGGLPVTLRGRFFADLLSGYISRVAPMIPCAVFAMTMSVSIEDRYLKLQEVMPYWIFIEGSMVKAFAELVITLIITYTFAYLISVIITVCCGKISSSVTYTSLVTAGLLVASVSAIGSLIEFQLGAGYFGDAITLLRYVPPLGTIVKAYSIFNDIGFIDFENTKFDLIDPAAVIIYIILAAALIALAYFIFKHRKPENTGHAIAVKHFYNVFAGVVAFSLVGFCFSAMYQLHMWWLSALVAAVISVIALTIFTVSNKEQRRHVRKNIIRIASVTAGCIAFLFIADKTGAFGTRYYNHSAANTKSISINIYDMSVVDPHSESFTIDNKDDIERFISATNKTLKNRAEELERGGEFSVTYSLENGKEVKRTYGMRYIYRSGEKPTAIEEMYENVYALPNYPKYSSEKVYSLLNNEEDKFIYAVTYDKFGTVLITEDHVKELSEILSREMREKFDINAKNAGMVICTTYKVEYGRVYSNSTEIPILECYTDTIAFIESLRQYDGEQEAFKVFAYSNSISLSLTVKLKNTDSEAVKELLSLFERENYEHYNSNAGSGGKIQFDIRSSNEIKYYIPDENTERALELIITIIQQQFAQKSL